MKKTNTDMPVWLKVILYFGILALATFIAGRIPVLNDIWFFLLLAAGLSAIFLRSTGLTLLSLNFVPKRRFHWKHLLLGTIMGVLMLMITTAWTLYLTGDAWHFSKVDPVFIFAAFLVCLWSAFAQEFVFRGYPFQALIAKYGVWTAQLTIVVPFALMHFHYGMNLQDMALTTLTTGLGSLLFGLAYLLTRHLALPIGLHLGWNFAQTLFPRTAGLGERALITISGNLTKYHFMNTIMPFIVVVILSILLLSLYFNKPVQSAATASEKA